MRITLKSLSVCIQFCIAMGIEKKYNFNKIVQKIIEKSLFTERQIEIILQSGTGNQIPRTISRGAYYRQRRQTNDKLTALLYSVILMYGLGVLPRDTLDVLGQISQQVTVIFDSDVDDTHSEMVMRLLDDTVQAAITNLDGSGHK